MQKHSLKNTLRKHDSIIVLAMILVAVLFAMLVGAIAIVISGANPVKAYMEFFHGFIGNTYGMGELINKFTPLVCCALSFGIATKSGFMNLGAEGQFAIGALVSCVVALNMGETTPILGILIPILAGTIAGALVSAVAGLMKIFFKANELLTTLMMNYVIDYFISWVVAEPLKNPAGNMEQSAAIPASSKLPILLPGSRLHLGVFFAIAALILIWFLQQRTTTGFEMRLSGLNAKCARYAGVNQTKSLLYVILISGALAGLGGSLELMGNQYKMMSGISNAFGFDGIGIAVMGRYTPLGIFLSSLLFGALRVGTQSMQRGSNVPVPILYILQGTIIIAVIVSAYFAAKIRESLVERSGER